MRRVLILTAVLCQSVFGYASYSGWCENGGVKVTVQGLSSPLTFQQSFPNLKQSADGPNVTVYATGTTDKATLYSDNDGTPLNNPFPCSSTGQYQFFSTNSVVDLLFSGSGISAFTRSAIAVTDGCPTNSACDAGYATLAAACTAAGSGTLYVTRQWNNITSQTLACKMTFLGNGLIRVASSSVVTISGLVTANPGQQIFDTTTNSAAFTAFTSVNSVIYAPWWGVIGDGTGAGGTDQAAKAQASVSSLGANGGTVVFPASALAYAIGSAITIPSNVTIQIQSGATVQKLHGSSSAPIFQCGDASASVSNCWVTGGGTIDGNRDNIVDTGDGGYIGIRFNGASNSGARNLTIENAWTDGIYVGCYGSDVEGSNLLIDNVHITNSRRNGISNVCGLGTRVTNSHIDNTTGTAPQAGIDVEPSAVTQLVSPFSVTNTEINNNVGAGIAFTGDTGDPNMQFSSINNYVHDNGGVGLAATNFYGTSPNQSGSLQIIGGSYLNNAGAAGMTFAGWSSVTVSTTATGSARGIDGGPNNGMVILGPGFLSGTLYSVSIDGPNAHAILAGATLDPSVPNLIQPGEDGNVYQPMFGIPGNWTGSGLAYWSSDSGTVNTVGTAVACASGTCAWSLAKFPFRQITINSVNYPVGSVTDATHLTLLGTGAGTQTGVSYSIVRSGYMSVAQYCGVADTSTFPNLYCNDGTIKLKMQPITGSGYAKVGTETNHPILLMSNNATPGTAGAVELSASGGKTIVNIASLPTSCSGLSSNTLWNNSGVINICP